MGDNPSVVIDEDWQPPTAVSNLPWEKLEVGRGSFRVKGTKSSQLSSARQRAERELGRQFKTKVVIEDNESWIRAWRVK